MRCLVGAEAGQTVPHVHYHVIPREGAGLAVGEDEMTDAERRNLVLGEGPRVMIEKEGGEEISRLVRAEITREVEELVGRGELLRQEGTGDLWVGGLERGLRI
jgi:diadenosine tetraphosphate (Ap4A) HIT family hydrolase